MAARQRAEEHAVGAGLAPGDKGERTQMGQDERQRATTRRDTEDLMLSLSLVLQ